jgi:predicted nucleic acid-binding protein
MSGMVDKEVFEEAKKKADKKKINPWAKITDEGLKELIRIEATKKEQLVQNQSRASDYYGRYWKLKDLLILAYIKNSKLIIKELTAE